MIVGLILYYLQVPNGFSYLDAVKLLVNITLFFVTFVKCMSLLAAAGTGHTCKFVLLNLGISFGPWAFMASQVAATILGLAASLDTPITVSESMDREGYW